MTASRVLGRVLGVAAIVTTLSLSIAACGDDDGGSFEDSCDSSNCGGCCDVTGECVSGADQDACGSNGDSCVECSSYQACEAGQCEACTPDNCLGCCDEEGLCQAGDQHDACGDGGEHCSNCASIPGTCYELDLSTHYCTTV
jgi:hypothetical protein